MKNKTKLMVFSSAVFLSSGALGVYAQSKNPDVLVIGSREAEVQLSGSGHFIDEQAVKENVSGDIHRLLRREVPGVSVVEEDGMGLLPNISFRGVNGSRSFKLTLMEDGVLAAPAPYAAPAAYYSPYVNRMSALEVLKGSSQVVYGPSTTGGVINYLSTTIPNSQRTQYKIVAGDEREIQVLANHGDKIGNFSYVLEVAARQLDGFRRIDAMENAQVDANATGQRRIEPMIKLAYDIEGQAFQRFELKYGHTDLQAKETYVGLTDEDFAKDHLRRYSATRFDVLDTTHTRTHLRHYLSFSNGLDIKTTAYYNKFHRNWYKLDGVDLSNAAQLSVLRDGAAGTFKVRANNRFYESRGVEQTIDKTLGSHQLKLGWRFHRDYERRKQWDDTYTQDANGAITDIARGALGSQTNNKNAAKAIAAFVQDEMTFGRFSIIPGIRFERVTFVSDDFKNVRPTRERTISYVNPGVGMRYVLTDATQVFGGIYQGSSLPDVSAATREVNPLDQEKSLNLEIGVRSRPSNFFQVESTLFYTQLSDMIAVSSAVTGTTDSAAIGEATTYGAELKTSYDLGAHQGWTFNNPYFLTATYTNTEIGNDYTNASYLTGKKGNKLPYAPELQFTAGTGIGSEKWSFDVAGTYVGSVYHTGENKASEEIDSHLTFDLSAGYNLTAQTTLTASVQNLLDKEYIVSRRPYGARAARPQTILLGLQSSF